MDWRGVTGFYTWPNFTEWVVCWLPPLAHCVEVGCYAGQSAAHLGTLLSAKGGRLELVDLFNAPFGVDVVRDTLAPLGPTLGRLIQGDSADMAAHFADGSLDYVFIDADHSYAAVSRDIDAWRPKVKPGGILAGHDFTPVFPGVIQAVTERFDAWHVHRGIDYGGNEGMRGAYWPVWWVRA